MSKKISVLVIGCGNMGASHATAYHNHEGFEICGLVSRGESKDKLNNLLKSNYKLFTDYQEAITSTKPDAVCISTYPDTHEEISLYALEHNCHIFLEKPIAADLEGSRKIITKAEESGKKLVVGYILRHHPIWKKFIIESKKLGKPVAMRMNLNQQSSGETWDVHKNLLASLSPIVDCGVHYLDVMCQITESKPVSVSAIGVRLSDDIPNDNYNYGQLQIRFEDGSVGWYEAGWGPMISETAFFVKDVIGPKGSVSIVSDDDVFKKDSDNLENHTKNNCLKIHSSELDKDQKFVSPNRKVVYDEDPGHQDLCDYEQQYFYKSIIEDVNLKFHMEDAYKSLQIALACDEAVKKSTTIYLD
jgi:predicted dehydrogenase